MDDYNRRFQCWKSRLLKVCNGMKGQEIKLSDEKDPCKITATEINGQMAHSSFGVDVLLETIDQRILLIPMTIFLNSHEQYVNRFVYYQREQDPKSVHAFNEDHIRVWLSSS